MKNLLTKKNEILAPCGNMDAFNAAIAAGCDAVYLAGKMFGARAFANNFTNEELILIINKAHLYGVKVYVTCNILVLENEVERFLKYVEFLHQNNVDALIMQDLGMINLVHKTYPNLEIHASTQLHIHNLEGAKFAEKIGIKRVVLARETPIELIKEIKEKTNLEIEIFVHGALCVSYSGMCLFARSIGPRSGNRGTCSGCCRLPYDLLDKDNNILNEKKYPLSMKDLNTVYNLNQLIDINVDSFKIEGRMKSPEYVYNTVKLYKEARDSYLKTNRLIVNNKYLDNLENIFSRGYTKGFIFHDKNLDNTAPNHKGKLIGEVIKFHNNLIDIKLVDDISIHDGLRIVNNTLEYALILNKFTINNNQVLTASKNQIITIKVNKYIPNNSKVYRTYSELLKQEVIDEIKNIKRKIPIVFTITIKENKPLKISLTDYEFHITYEGSILEHAEKQALTKEIILEKFSKINNTIYRLDKCEIDLDNNLFIPISKLNNIKREMLLELDQKRINKFQKEFIKKDYKTFVDDYKKENEYTLYTNNLDDITNKYKYIYSDNLDNTIKKIPKVVYNYNKYDINQEYLIGEIGSLNKFKNVITDFSFNVTNSYTVDFLHSLGVKRITLSVELTDNDIKNLIDSYHKRLKKHPNLEIIKTTRLELMVLKLDLFKYGNVCYLQDRFKNKYLVKKKNDLCYIYDYKETKLNKNDEYYFNLGINYLRVDKYE